MNIFNWLEKPPVTEIKNVYDLDNKLKPDFLSSGSGCEITEDGMVIPQLL